MKHLFVSVALVLSASIYANAQVCGFPDKSWKCCDATSAATCPNEGCGGDPLLNARKNITEIPAPATVEDWEFNDMLDVIFPASWSSGMDRE